MYTLFIQDRDSTSNNYLMKLKDYQTNRKITLKNILHYKTQTKSKILDKSQKKLAS